MAKTASSQHFKKSEPDRATPDWRAEQLAVDAKTAKLRALRLAKEAADAEQARLTAADKPKPAARKKAAAEKA